MKHSKSFATSLLLLAAFLSILTMLPAMSFADSSKVDNGLALAPIPTEQPAIYPDFSAEPETRDMIIMTSALEVDRRTRKGEKVQLIALQNEEPEPEPAKLADAEPEVILDVEPSEVSGHVGFGCAPTRCDSGCRSPLLSCRNPCQQKCSNINIGGWLSGGIYANAWGASDNALPMRNEVGGSFDQLWLYAEKKVDTCSRGIDWGGRVDFMFGADSQYTRVGPSHSTLPMLPDLSDNGWDHDWTTSDDGIYGFAMPQLYGELGIGRLTLRAGHFFSLIGYERIPVVENFFYSRSYAFGIEPITHMGAIASYQLSNCLEVTGGVTNGWDNGWLNPSGAITGLGKISAKLSNCTSLHYALTFGDLMPGNHVYMQSIVLECQLTKRLQYVLQSDFSVDTGGAADVRQDYGMNQYLFYMISNCLKIGTRVEWLRAETFRTRAHNRNVFETRTGVTLGLNYTPKKNLMIRPEIRWDNATGRMSNDFNDRQNSYQFAGGVDVILKF